MSVRKIISCATFVALLCSNLYSQEDTSGKKKYDDLSLKDLLDVKIVSVSKKQESLFEAPLSASVLTKEEISRAGCTSIMEAMRLIPGMIVREQNNGNYDIHLRGMDNVPPNSPLEIVSNTTTLVMIDNRPVYSYLRGGIFWETLPIDLNDIERIEVVKGPAAALYGPNAVNGVINIITRQAAKNGLYLVVNSQQGTNNTHINNISVGYRSKTWSVITSANYQHRDRSQTSYFEYNRNTWLEHPDYFIDYFGDSVGNAKELYPDPALALEKYAANVFISYDPGKKIRYSFATGIQYSTAQKVSMENEITPYCNTSSKSRYADLKASIKGLTAQLSYNQGTQLVEFQPGNKYDFDVIDANIEYNYTRGNFMLKPALSYRTAVYDDTKYSDYIHRGGIFNTRGRISTQSASLRSEYGLLNNKLRLIGGFSFSKFNYPDSTYLSYELAVTYKLNKNHLLRVVYSQAPRSSNVFDTYVDQAFEYYPTSPGNYNEVAVVGNKNLRLLTADMIEIGYRGSIAKRMAIDIEVFDILARNFSIPVESHPIIEFDGTDTVHETPSIMTTLPLRLNQEGITISLAYATKKLLVKPFVTLQRTIARNYAPYINMPDANIPGADQKNIYSGIGRSETLKSTPAIFGGAYINYSVSPTINCNINAYYYTAQKYSHISNIIINDGVKGIDNIKAKLILNATVTYEVVKGMHFFVSGKNILNDNAREFFRTDTAPFRLFGGINYEL